MSIEYLFGFFFRIVYFQVLAFSVELGCITAEFHPVHCVPATALVSVYCYFCSTGNASFRREIQF